MDWRMKVVSEGVVEVPVKLELERWMRARVGEGEGCITHTLISWSSRLALMPNNYGGNVRNCDWIRLVYCTVLQ